MFVWYGVKEGDYIGLRAFLPRAAIPDSKVVNYNPPCSRRFKKQNRPDDVTLASENLQRSTPLYQGRNTATFCPRAINGSLPVTSSSCGSPYANYRNPEWVGNLVYVTTDTTGISGGGVVIGIVRRDERSASATPSPIETRTCPATGPAVRWFWGRHNLSGKNLYGWIPTREGPAGSVRTC